MLATFRSLKVFNYRTWAQGALVSNVGTWMQRTAQDWVVLTELTQQNATAVGIVMALQFGPQAALLPFTGWAADRFNLRKLIFVTQTAAGLLALGLGTLSLTGTLRLWQVYLFAGLLGCVSAFDSPARQTFVSELVDTPDLPNAVALNSTSFNTARLIGPAIAGVLITLVGSGWVFLINAASFGAVLISLARLRSRELHPRHRDETAHGGLMEGFRYVGKRPDLKILLLMYFLIGTFGFNFPIHISTMAVSVFRKGAHGFGFLTSIMAAGSVLGALFSARRTNPGPRVLLVGAATLGVGYTLSAFAPSYGLFGAALALVGIAAQTFTVTTNSVIQLTTAPAMRGRVLAIMLAIFGCAPIGAPLVGRVADIFGPRWALGIGAAAGFLAVAVGGAYFGKGRQITGAPPR